MLLRVSILHNLKIDISKLNVFRSPPWLRVRSLGRNLPRIVDVRDVPKSHALVLELPRNPGALERRYLAVAGNISVQEAVDHPCLPTRLETLLLISMR
jgi:hypothetical protein